MLKMYVNIIKTAIIIQLFSTQVNGKELLCITNYYWTKYYNIAGEEKNNRDSYLVTDKKDKEIENDKKIKWVVKSLDGPTGEIQKMYCEHSDIDQIVCFTKAIYDVQTFILHNYNIGSNKGPIRFTSYYHAGFSDDIDIIKKGNCKEVN